MKLLKFTKGDFFGGLTAGIVALPLALAFGDQTGLGAAAGLYGAIFVGLLASIFGGTPSQISGPTGPMTVISAATVALFISQSSDGSVTAVMGAIIASFVLAGIFQILMGIFKIGSLIKFIPYPVISGFMSGIGVIIILLQIFPAIGLASPPTTIDVVKEIVPALQSIDTWALVYSALTILIIYLFPKITKAVPSTLVALIAVTILSVILNKDVPIIGDIPQGLPPIHLDGLLNIDAKYYTMILEAAATLAALGAIDSLLTSVVADNVTKTKHNSNKELIGQGIGNSVAGIFGGLPGAGATMRTLVNIRSGGRHKISGVIHALVLLTVLLGAGKYAALIPKSVLAGILITVGIGILDYKGFRHINKVPVSDALVMIVVLLVTVFLDLLIAVGIGMVIASFIFMKQMSDIAEEKTKVKEMQELQEEEGWSDEKMPEQVKDNVLVKHIEGPLFFGFATGFTQGIHALKNIRFVIIRMEKVPYVDQSGLYALEDAILALEQKGIHVLLTGLQQQPKNRLERIKIIPSLIEKNNIFNNFSNCVDWLREKINNDKA
ncbi:MAG: SulP family inorganic anion transporter [Chitinophagaceae bacterium]|nr:SulP family inorganic anion transporter [Chitinophagaceae bacterium]